MMFGGKAQHQIVLCVASVGLHHSVTILNTLQSHVLTLWLRFATAVCSATVKLVLTMVLT